MNVKEHLLVCLMEECAEVQQAVSKLLRFGHGKNPYGSTNEHDLLVELEHVSAIRRMLELNGMLSTTLSATESWEIGHKKSKKLADYMELSHERGLLKYLNAEEENND